MLETLLAEAPKGANAVAMTVYVHRQIPGDLAVHLCWRSTDERSMPGSMGRLIAEGLRTLGLVDHAVWDEVAV